MRDVAEDVHRGAMLFASGFHCGGDFAAQCSGVIPGGGGLQGVDTDAAGHHDIAQVRRGEAVVNPSHARDGAHADALLGQQATGQALTGDAGADRISLGEAKNHHARGIDATQLQVLCDLLGHAGGAQLSEAKQRFLLVGDAR